MPRPLALLAALALLHDAAGYAAAAVGRAGPEIRVNSHAASTFEENAGVVALRGGSFVVVWEESGTSSGLGSETGTDVWGQLIDAATVPDGSAFLVNSASAGEQRGASGAGLSNGGFVVSWSSYRPGVDPYPEVRAQRFDSHGAKVGPEFAVSDEVAEGAGDPSVASYSGGFVVVWSSASGLHSRRYSDDGVAGTTFVVDASSTDSPSVSANSSGAFVVAWSGTDPDSDIFARRVKADDETAGPAFLVNTRTEGYQVGSTVALSEDGSFFVAWWNSPFAAIDGEDTAVTGRTFDSEGVARGPQFVINQHTEGREIGPRIVVGPDGAYGIAWWEWSSAFDGSGQAIVFRRYDANGEPIADAIPVNRIFLADQIFPDLAVGPDGGFLVAWQSEHEDPSNFNDAFPQRIRAQRLCDRDNPSCDVCAGFDDGIDVDGDLEPDGCDACVQWIPEQTPLRSSLRYDSGDTVKPRKLTMNMRFSVAGGFDDLDPTARGARIFVGDQAGHTMYEESLPAIPYDAATGRGWALVGRGRHWKFLDSTSPRTPGTRG